MKKILIITLFFASCKHKDHLQQMLTDRPQMKTEDTALYNRAKEVFKDAQWSSSEPDGTDKSCFSMDTKEIMLKKNMSFEESWVTFFYESYNLKNADKFKKIYQDALDGKYTRSQWVKENAHLEYLAAQDFLRFSDTLKLYFESHSLDTKSLDYYKGWFNKSFSEWIGTTEKDYPWNTWGSYYDTYLSKK